MARPKNYSDEFRRRAVDEVLETAIINWIYWYNEARLHGENGDIPPAEYEQLCYTYNQPAPTGN